MGARVNPQKLLFHLLHYHLQPKNTTFSLSSIREPNLHLNDQTLQAIVQRSRPNTPKRGHRDSNTKEHKRKIKKALSQSASPSSPGWITHIAWNVISHHRPKPSPSPPNLPLKPASTVSTAHSHQRIQKHHHQLRSPRHLQISKRTTAVTRH